MKPVATACTASCGFGRSRRRFKQFSRRFGSSTTPGNEMSFYQTYTGMPGGQMASQLAATSPSVISNFYTTGSSYGRRRRRHPIDPFSYGRRRRRRHSIDPFSYGRRRRHRRHHHRPTALYNELKERRRFGGGGEMSLDQGYTGMPPAQMGAHLAGVDPSLLSNYYTDGWTPSPM